ncbi:MAG: hypothetical protein RBT71_03465 [Flavobacteriales bacterium]|jgi:hypothetical protein|nr:hypothetical protein [Flavobacteriales bacterium]
MNTQHPAPSTQHPTTKGLVTGFLMIILMASGVLTSCQKEGAGVSVPEGADMAPANVTPLVRAFVDRAQGVAAPKADAVLSADSVEWYVEAALNYGVAKAWLEFNDVVADSAVVSVPLHAGAVPAAAAYEAFNTLYGLLATVEEEGVQHLAIVDVAAKEAGNELRLDVRYLVGSGYEKSVNANYPPGMALRWWQMAGGCACGTEPSTFCADKKIQQRVQQAIQVAMGPNDYWTNVETWDVGVLWPTSVPNKTYSGEFFFNPNNTSGKSNQNYWIYLCWDYDCDSCLEHDDLSFHTQGTYDAMMWIRNNHCSTKTPYGVVVDGDMGLGLDPMYFHQCAFTYGNKQSGSGS